MILTPTSPTRLYHFMTLPTFGIYFGTKKKKVASEKPMSKKKKKRPSLHENVFSPSPLVPTFLTSFLSNSDKPVFHPLVDQEGR